MPSLRNDFFKRVLRDGTRVVSIVAYTFAVRQMAYASFYYEAF